MARTSRASNLHLTLPATAEPLRQRIAGAVIVALRAGALRPGDLLPASRILALELGVSRAAVVDAYDELTAAGFVDSRAGSGTRVATGADAAAQAGVTPHVAPVAETSTSVHATPPPDVLDLTPGFPDTALISPRDWRSAWRSATTGPVPNTAPGPGGHFRLREALSVHLRRTRGIVADADEIVVVPGALAALRTLAIAADLPGRRIAFEDPGYTKARRAFEFAGVRARPVAVDLDGLDPANLQADDAAVYCTPAHQYPMGSRMSAARRAALVADAAATGRLIVEDDYDGEFRYGVASLPALRAIEGGRNHVAYVGTASKIVSPSLRLAWLVPPVDLLPRVHDALAITGETACAVTADAFAEFTESGSLTRHLARTSRTYAARRQAFVDALRTYLPDVEPLGVEAGLHVALRLPDGTDDDAVADEVQQRGVTVCGLAGYRVAADGPRGLLCGYARLPESRADEAAKVIAGVIRARVAGAVGIGDSCTTSGS
ncbi:GntR family transcriptional regulator [Rhodococcus sp. OK519]|uniref:MocR-like pyridoxine biosynthesis transcription factor PdxR n=1 Tax=Rhodococcus sp. OK519 TaxID=2135729 RepID=UPI000D37991C|nr:GntR family transcriptional regulator [Rhodococcus sp. OK519]